MPDSSLAEVQRSSADETVRIERVDSVGTRRGAAYSVAERPVAAGDQPADVSVLLTRIPRTAAGEADLKALESIPVASAEQLAACEKLLSSLNGIRESAVLLSQWLPVEPPVHLEQLASTELLRNSVKGDTGAETIAEPAPKQRRNHPPALAHGDDLSARHDAKSLIEIFLNAAQRSRPDDLTFVDHDGTAVRQSLAQLLQSAQKILGGLRAAGLQPGSRVVLQLPANADVLAAFWACLLGGCPPVIVPVPPSYTDESRGLDQLAHIITTLDRPWLITNQRLQNEVTTWLGQRGLAIEKAVALESLREHAPDDRHHSSSPEDIAFFSTSSGSTGQPKCVQLTHLGLLDRAFGANQLCGHAPDDVILNWLPLDHIGSISDWHLRCVLLGCRMVYVPKEYVISQPLRWLDLIHQHRITHSWAPNFAYSLIRDALTKQDPAAVKDRWDLSCVHGLLTAGEAVSPKVVAEFLHLLKPFGFAQTAIRPAFGMAELGSGVTYFLPTADEPLKFHTVSRSSLETGLVRVPEDHPDAITFTDLGRPVPGVSIRIADAQRNVVPEETVGQVHIRGSAVMAGYYRNPAANAVLLDDGWFDTGDLGFLTEGRLVLTGRAKDVIIVNGSNYYCGEIEEVVESVPGVEPSFTAACAPRRSDQDREGLVVFFCTDVTAPEELVRLIGRIRQAVARQVGVKPDYLLPVTRQEIPKTAIGKLQRAQLTKQFEAGYFDELARRIDLLTRNERTLPNWFFHRHWQPAELIVAGAQPPKVAVLFGNGVVLDALYQQLQAAGTRTVRIDVGESFSELATDYFRINPRARDDFDLLLESFLWQEIVVDHWIVGDIFAMGCEAAAVDASSNAAGSQRALVESLIEGLNSRHEEDQEAALTVLCRNAIHAADEEAPLFEQAAVVGLLRSVAQEHSWLTCRCLDFDCSESAAATAELVLRELSAAIGEREIAFRQGRRYLPRLERVAFQPPPAVLPMPRRGAYLIVGPKTVFREALSQFLEERLDARLALIDDSDSADDLGRLLSQAESDLPSPVAGVFYLPAKVDSHPADTPGFADRLMQQVTGLHDWLRDRPEMLLVSIASIDALMAGRGRAGESQAFALLDARNQSRRRSAPVCSLWVEPADEHYRRQADTLRAGGYLEVNPAAWLHSVLGALSHRADDWVIGLDAQNPYVRRLTTNGDFLWERPTAFYAAEPTFNVRRLDEISWPNDDFGAPIRLNFVAVEELPKDEQGEIDRERLRRGVLRKQETSAAPTTEIEQQVAAIFRDVLGLSAIGLHDNFFELGGHSVLLMQVHGRLQDLFGPKLQLVDMFKYPSVAALAQALGDGKASNANGGQTLGRQRADVRRKVRGGGETPAEAETGVAVIGMACRLPGANTIEEYWQNLRDGVESITFFTDAEALAAGVDPDRVRDPRYVNAAPMIPHVEDFDAEFFGYTPREAKMMDPQQRVFLECAWEVLEDAGYNPKSCPESVGVFAGAVMNTYFVNNLAPRRAFLESDDHSEVFTLDSMSGFLTMVANDKDYLTTRISYKLNLRGPSVNVQTACSTSLVAIHLAARAVANGECDMALAGGVSVKVPQDTGYLYQADVIVSPDGHCRAFDAKAEGTIFGNGAGAVLLKRLDDAVNDGDHIYAVIRGSAFNNDGGNKLGYMAPSQEGQAAVVAEALAVANVPAESIRFIEAHGTGTSLGDPIEIAGLKQGLGTSERNSCAVGSVKTNLGHLQIASGVAGFIKAALSVYHGEIPPTLHFETPNPKIGFERTPFFVNNKLLPWPEAEHPRRAGVNSLGIGGANCHVILEQAPAPSQTVETASRPRHVLQLSAGNDTALRALAGRYLAWFETHPEASLADVCYTANVGRAPLKHRLPLTATSSSELREELESRLADAEHALGKTVDLGTQPRIAFLFTGQGSQSPGMARTLYETQPTFRRVLGECAEIVDPLLPKPLLSVLFNDAVDLSIHQTGFAQVALFSIEYALARLWQSWGVRPAVLIGHSLGEYVAACVAGVWSLADALKLVAVRSRLMQALPAGGGMAVVTLSISDIEKRLAASKTQISVAAINAPQQVVLSGELSALRSFVSDLERDQIAVQWLKVSHAFHSTLMEPMLAEFRRTLDEVTWQTPGIPIISNLTGSLAGEEMMTADYWCRHLREPVRFCQGVEALGPLADVFLEIGPQPVLVNLGRQALPDRAESAWLPSLRRSQEDWDVLLDSLCSLSVQGVEIDWAGFDGDYFRRRIPLPTYPFQRKRHWIERPAGGISAAQAAAAISGGVKSRHPLLHQRWRSPVISETVFETQLSVDDLPWLADHRFIGMAIMPATGYLAMAMSAARELFGSQPVRLSDVSFSEVLPLDEEISQRVQLIVSKPEAKSAAFQLISLPNDAHADGEGVDSEFRLHARGNLAAAAGIDSEIIAVPSVEDLQGRSSRHISRDEFYAAIREHDVEMRDQFQAIDECWAGETELWGRVRIPLGLGDASAYPVHPSVLDSCLQLMPGGVAYDSHLTYLPVGVEKLTVFHTPGSAGLWCRSVVRPQSDPGDRHAMVDAWLIDETGRICVALEGLRYQCVSKAALRRRFSPAATNILYETTWRSQPLSNIAGEALPGRWLILADRDGVGERLAARLEQQGHDCVLAFAGDAFRRTDTRTYRLPASERPAWERLFHETGGAGPRPFDGVVYLWGMSEGHDVPQSVRQACGGLLTLTQFLLASGWTSLPAMMIVTRGSQAASEHQAGVNSAAAALWGFGRTLDLEHAEWSCRRIDLDSAVFSGETDQLLAELLSPDAEREVAYRDGERLAPRLEKLRPSDGVSVQIRPDLTYLITGGMGALGLRMARWLVDAGARNVALVSRTGPSEALRSTLSSWKDRGVQVTTMACDVADEAAVSRLFADLDSKLPPLAGLVHAAGVLDDGAVDRLDWARFERVLAAKAFGAWHLHRATQDRSLDFFVCYSSIASGLGSPGQANYSAANAVLDAMCQHRRSRGLPALSVQWGPWAGGGMAGQLAESVRQQHARRGLEPLDDEAAFEALTILLRSGVAVGMAIAVDWARYRQELPSGQAQPLLDVVAPFVARVNSEERAFRRQWEAAAGYERRELVAGLTRRLLSQAVGFEEVGGDDSFFDLGLDSLSSVQLRNDLQDYLSCELPTTLVFMHPTLNQLNSYLTEVILALESVDTQPSRNGHEEAFNGTGAATNGKHVAGDESHSLDALSDEELAARLMTMLAELQTESL